MTETLYAETVDIVAKNVAANAAALLPGAVTGATSNAADNVVSARKQKTARWFGRPMSWCARLCPCGPWLLVTVPLKALFENYYVQLREVL